MKRWFGVIAVFAIFGCAAALAGFNVWFHYNQTRQIQQRWGAEDLARIAYAAEVHLVKLVPAERDSAKTTPLMYRIDSRDFRAAEPRDISNARGLSNFRYALGQDASFEWDETPGAETAWPMAILFEDGTGTTLFAFNVEAHAATLSDRETRVKLGEKMAAGLPKFIEESLAPLPPAR